MNINEIIELGVITPEEVEMLHDEIYENSINHDKIELLFAIKDSLDEESNELKDLIVEATADYMSNVEDEFFDDDMIWLEDLISANGIDETDEAVLEVLNDLY